MGTLFLVALPKNGTLNPGVSVMPRCELCGTIHTTRDHILRNKARAGELEVCQRCRQLVGKLCPDIRDELTRKIKQDTRKEE